MGYVKYFLAFTLDLGVHRTNGIEWMGRCEMALFLCKYSRLYIFYGDAQIQFCSQRSLCFLGRVISFRIKYIICLNIKGRQKLRRHLLFVSDIYLYTIKAREERNSKSEAISAIQALLRELKFHVSVLTSRFSDSLFILEINELLRSDLYQGEFCWL